MKNSDDARQLRARLTRAGFQGLAVDAAWPKWWTEEAEASPSARAELRFSLARKLGLEPNSLLEDASEPRFVWKDAKFKNLSAETAQEKAALVSFGIAIGAVLSASCRTPFVLGGTSASNLRRSILSTKTSYVRLIDLLSTCWAVGVPVVHLRVFPFSQKRMAGMAVGTRNAAAILLGKDSEFPPHIAFYLAHEIGHVALGHVPNNSAIVDLEEHDDKPVSGDDEEEVAADRYALELLTGSPEPAVLPESTYNASELARVSLRVSKEVGIEPGTLALCFGYSTNDWATANAAMRNIYSERKPVWREVNRVAVSQLDTDSLPEDFRHYLSTVLGEREDA